MTEPIRCGQCGAPFRAAEERFCSYCGTQRPKAPAPPPAEPDLAARFAAARAHAALATMMRHRPSMLGHVVGGVFSLAFLIVFCLFAGGFVLMIVPRVLGGDSVLFGGIFCIVPVLILGGGLVMLWQMGRRMARFRSAPLERKLARILDERTEVSGGKHSHTTYHATLEWEDRTRCEYTVSGPTAGKITRDDIGLAYVKGDVLLEFARLDV